MTSTTADTAKVFTTGRSQAVRLPKAYRFNTKEVTIERQGDAIVLRPKPDADEWWSRLEAAMDGLAGIDFVPRERGPLKDDIEPFD